MAQAIVRVYNQSTSYDRNGKKIVSTIKETKRVFKDADCIQQGINVLRNDKTNNVIAYIDTDKASQESMNVVLNRIGFNIYGPYAGKYGDNFILGKVKSERIPLAEVALDTLV
jgi:hypothetical protein